MSVETASGPRTGMQLVNRSANRLHCQSAPSAALMGDVRLTDSNAATQANIAQAAISTTTLWVLGWEIMAFSGSMAATIRKRLHSVCDLTHMLIHIFAVPRDCVIDGRPYPHHKTRSRADVRELKWTPILGPEAKLENGRS